MMPPAAVVDAFIEAASVSLQVSHLWGDLEEANRIRQAHPDVTRATIHGAAVSGDADAVAACLADDPTSAVTPGGPRAWDPLTYLCFSRYLRLERDRADAFLRSATLLLEAGARATTGFYEPGNGAEPSFESALYGAAGVAHDAALTRLLLAQGADPNDGEVSYHAPEWNDLEVVAALVETGRLTADSLATMLIRKHDWHDAPGVRYLLANGADPNRQTPWGVTALHQAVRRDNAATVVELLLAHGADPSRVIEPRFAAGRHSVDAAAMAAWRGRADLLDLFERAGAPMPASGLEGLMVACARGRAASAAQMLAGSPLLQDECRRHGGEWLALAAGNGNLAALRCLVGLGIPAGAVWLDGDGYFEIPPSSTALHVAAWRARHDAVRWLLERGAPVDAEDGAGRTPLQLAVRACTVAYWRDRRDPASIAALLSAGADASRVILPTGYDDADKLLIRGPRSWSGPYPT
jgi:ankyrin repeat protein